MATSSSDIETRRLTLRLNTRTLRAAQQAARSRGVTLNALVRELLVELQREEEERALAAAYEKLGADPASDVEFAVRAQGKVARRG